MIIFDAKFYVIEMDDIASVTDQLVPQLSLPRSSLSVVSELPYSLAPSVKTNKAELPLQIGKFTMNECD